MADELPASLVVGERHVAVRTACRPPALRTLDIGREPAAVLEQHHLLAPPERRFHLVEQQLVEMRMPFAAFGGADRIRNEYFGRPGIPVPLRQGGEPVLSASGIDPCLERRRGASQQRPPAPQPRHHHGAVARVVTRRRVGLLVTGIVLLVDDDQLQPFERQEYRRAHADHELAPLGAVQAQVGLRAAAVRKFRVVRGHTAAENALHAFDQLRREGDLGHQQQHVAAPRQHFGDQVDVYLGLARPRNAVQQRRGLPGELPPQRLQRRELRRGQLRQAECRSAALDGAFALRRDDVPLAFEGMQHGIVGPQQAPCHLARRNPLPVPGRGQFEERFVLPGRTPFELLESFVQSSFVVQPGRQGHVALRTGAKFLFGKLLLRVARRLHQRRQPHAHHLARRTHVVRRDPLPEGHLLRREQGCAVQDALYGFDGFERGAAVMHAPHDPRVEFAGAELYGHGLPRLDMHPFGHCERVGGLRQRQDYIGIEGHQGLLMA